MANINTTFKNECNKAQREAHSQKKIIASKSVNQLTICCGMWVVRPLSSTNFCLAVDFSEFELVLVDALLLPFA